MFNSCDVFQPYVAHIDDIFKDFTSYKVRVPVTGAIILDETYERVRQELTLSAVLIFLLSVVRQIYLLTLFFVMFSYCNQCV